MAGSAVEASGVLPAAAAQLQMPLQLPQFPVTFLLLHCLA
jgi:hypothetical protein